MVRSEHGRICPYCHSEDTELLRGRELEIRSIEAVDEAV